MQCSLVLPFYCGVCYVDTDRLTSTYYRFNEWWLGHQDYRYEDMTLLSL